LSLGIAFKGPEGIVLAADSRVTLTATRADGMMLPATYDNATKLLKVAGQDHVAAVTYGQGAIGTNQPRTASSFLPEFETDLRAEETGRLSVEAFARSLSGFFVRQWEVSGMPADADAMVFLIGGYDADAPYGRVFRVSVPDQPAPIEMNEGELFGVTWGGQLQSATRLLTGFDPQLPALVAEYLALEPQRAVELSEHLRQTLGLPIPYQFLPLQDCVDLAVLLIRTTAQLQAFLVDIRGVGGEIDVATITRTEGFRPLHQKEVKVGDAAV
jgi:hypothetical protein